MIDYIDHGQQDKQAQKVGYGSKFYNGRMQRLHRIAYCEANCIDIEDIKGQVIRHTCDNPRCINPEHLVVGTQMDNIHDRQKRNRQAKGEACHTTVLTEADVQYIRAEYVCRSRTKGAPYFSKIFGISKQHITAIIRREYWQHI